MTIDPNEQIALNFNANTIIDAIDRDLLPQDLALSKTLLLMMMPKKNHPKAAFWTDPAVFIQKMAVMIIRFPKIENSMKLAVQADPRLNTYAGAYGVDFATAIAELCPLITSDQMDRAGVKPKDMTATRFRNALRNNYGDTEGDLPLQAIYNGVAKLILHD